MKITLIRAGGFTGRTQTAETIVSHENNILQEELQLLFSEAPPAGTSMPFSGMPDTFSYFLEYQGIRIHLPDPAGLSPVLATLFSKLEAQLHYS